MSIDLQPPLSIPNLRGGAYQAATSAPFDHGGGDAMTHCMAAPSVLPWDGVEQNSPSRQSRSAPQRPIASRRIS